MRKISLVVVHILNFRDLIVVRFPHIELITCLISKVDRVKVQSNMLLVQYGQTSQRDLVESSEYVPQLMILHCSYPHYTFL